MPGTASISWLFYFRDVEIFSFDTEGTGSSGAVLSLGNVPAGALLVLTTACNASTNGDFTVSSSPSLTWTKQVDASGVNTGIAEIWTAPFADGGLITVTATRHSGDRTAAVLYALTNAEGTLGGASNTETFGSAPSATVVTTRENSIIFGVTSDWNGVDGSSRTLRDGATETFYYRPDGGITSYIYYKQCTTEASHTLGVSSPTGQIAATAILEIRSSESG